METKKDRDWYIQYLSYTGETMEETKERLRLKRAKKEESLKNKHGK